LHLRHAQGATSQEIEELDPERVGKRLEELGLELPQSLRIVATSEIS
jgi:hypothetical protein